ncbi:hypothetical protein CC85DRAFT_330142 [Cutaneotrichosporon oleaginosum]|uniref:Uncharacterized protein n=1 Tax=Cutaneotrichosporon oleaginosum TaxID=879819 RepID=A0A0J0XGH6_9TREE|nr:uncharacterized protein CC85DRAFT_330142 [Cutaneotrichosporon oleaginosum]KLT40168.1 hypothetical protein CC85DRAFT_330142 [Cutaneotrichosporon oleaginosum]TXT06867.1 hypothetical protein COLE_06198 [Cutaneotrichosporon oleaginosum]
MPTATANAWQPPPPLKAGPSRMSPWLTPHDTLSPSETGSTYSASVHSVSASVHSGLSSGRNLSTIFTRRGSLPGVRSAKSVRSLQSSSGFEDDLEMLPLPRASRKRLVPEHHEARTDRRKAEAAVAKWRKWIVEQPQQATTITDGPIASTSSSVLFRADRQSGETASNTNTPPSTLGRSGRDLSARGSLSIAGPSSSGFIPWNAEASETSHPASLNKALVPGALDIYTTDSVRALRDVELAVDPSFFENAAPLRVKRLSTHPRVSPNMENPFAAIDTLLSRRRIRPLVIELVQALGGYIDAVWCTTYPDRPCPWAGVPVARRASVAGALESKSWKSWTITAVQEGKRQGFLPSPPTLADVEFYEREIRHGLRDVDEAVNRRKDLGWAFGETVVKGGYGDIAPSNVMTDGQAGNIPRLLNDLEEALWGDALPAPSDLAFEHDSSFDPFSVYREGDELIGVGASSNEARDAALRELFGEYYAAPLSPEREVPGLSSSPRSRFDESPRTPADAAVPAMPGMPPLDFSRLGVLQEMSREEQLELGRRRHQEYLERKKGEGLKAD